MNITIENIRTAAQAGKLKKSFPSMWGYLVHRKVSARCTYVLLKFFPQITPNQVSVGMLVLSILGAAIMLLDTRASFFIGVALLYLAFVLDKVDGELARYLNKHSIRGMYLDEIYHILFPALVFLTFISISEAAVAPRFAVGAALGAVALRYHRKIALGIFVKRHELIASGALVSAPMSPRVMRMMGFLPLRMTSIVERYDILLIGITAAYLFSMFSVPPIWQTWFVDTLVLYTGLYMLAFIRGMISGLSGKIDLEVQQIKEHGY